MKKKKEKRNKKAVKHNSVVRAAVEEAIAVNKEQRFFVLALHLSHCGVLYEKAMCVAALH